MKKFTEEEKSIVRSSLIEEEIRLNREFGNKKFTDQKALDEYMKKIEKLIKVFAQEETEEEKPKRKLMYNVNVGGIRYDKAETYQEALKEVEQYKKDVYLTKSVYEWDKGCETWNEIAEYNVNEVLNENFGRTGRQI